MEETLQQITTETIPPKEKSPIITKLVKFLRLWGKTSPQEDTVQEVLTQEESIKDERKKALGFVWQQELSYLSEVTPPPNLKDGGALALLSTNEYFNPENFAETIGEVDGYICGVGFGNILSLVTLSPKENLPKAVLAIDVIPSVVLAGRISIELMKTSLDFNSFIKNMNSEDSLEKLKKKILEEETSPVIRERLENVDVKDILDDVKREFENTPSQGITDGKRISVLAAIRSSFANFKTLATEGNLAISLGDATGENIIKSFATLPEFKERKNLIYLTNIIDHITQRGLDFGPNGELFSILQPYSLLANGKTLFLDTTQIMDYKLRAQNTPPIYTPQDFGYRDTEEYLRIKKYRTR